MKRSNLFLRRADNPVAGDPDQRRPLALHQGQPGPPELGHRDRRRDLQQQGHRQLLRAQHCQ